MTLWINIKCRLLTKYGVGAGKKNEQDWKQLCAVPPLPLCFCSALWPSGSQVYSASGQHIGHVEQSHGDILSDGSSCGARAMLPNCQADFSAMRSEEESQTNRALAQSPIAKQCRRAQRGVPGESQEAEMKQKARSNLFVVDGTWFFSAARLKGRTARRNEKGITSAVQTWRPLPETGLPYQVRGGK